MKGACVILQSGGPTCVINASLYGVIRQAQNEENITAIYGSLNGVEGLINDNLIDLNNQDDKEIEYLKTTPSAILGSSRHRLPKDLNDETYNKIFETFKKHNIRYFFLIGGNDSMDTANKISSYFDISDYKCQILGVPKTIDNDLAVTDHTPGYGSAIKYISNLCCEIVADVVCYKTGKVTIIEVMGRDAGWLTAGSKLASLTGYGPDLIYVPEVTFDVEEFLNKVKEVYDRKKNCIVAISEGIRNEKGEYIINAFGKQTAKDTFGHAYLGGTGSVIASLVTTRLNLPSRNIELNLPQRCASHIMSLTDINESVECGKMAVKKAISGLTGHMVIINRVSNNPYKLTFESKPLNEIANIIKFFPTEWVIDNCDISSEFIEYALPLIKGEPVYELNNGLPRFAKLDKKIVK